MQQPTGPEDAVNSGEPGRKRRRGRVWFVRAVVCLLSLTAGLAAAEGVLRILEATNRDFNRYFFILADHGEKLIYDPDVGWRNAPGWSRHDAGTKIKVNSLGHRGPERTYDKPPDVKRVLVLGDSFTYGFDVNDDETFCVVLEDILRRNAGPYEVLNTGVTGYGTDQQYLTLLREGDRYEPDVVVLAFFTENDFTEIQLPLLSYTAKPYFADETLRLMNVPVPIHASSNGHQAFFHPTGLIRTSAVYRLIFFNAVSSYWAASTLDVLQLCNSSEMLEPNVRGDAGDLAAAIIGGMAAYLEERECPLVVMKFGRFLDRPTNYGGPEFETKLRARIPGLRFLDLDREFQERRLSTKLLTEGAGDYHWNAVGHRHVAAILYEFLIREDLLSPATGIP